MMTRKTIQMIKETEEDEDDDPVGDEPSEEQIDKIEDLSSPKIQRQTDEEEDEEEEPELQRESGERRD